MSNSIEKILLFGSTGMLGNYIHTYFTKNTKIKVINVHYRIRQDTLDTLEEILENSGIDKYTCIINCIGLIPQRKETKQNDKDYFLINGLFPHVLWDVCKKYGAKMIQPTTDCVFSGKTGNYIESDIHDETNAYGMSKSLGEPNGSTIIRTSIIGLEKNNKKSFLEWVRSSNGKHINGWSNHMWNGITCLEYCHIIEQIIQQNLFWSGVKHIYSPTPVSKYDMAQYIINTFTLDIEITPLISQEPSDKTLSSIHETLFEIKELELQINELKYFKLE